MTVRGSKKCCISNAADETDGGMLWNNREVDGNIRSECEGGEGTDCAEGDSETVTWLVKAGRM